MDRYFENLQVQFRCPKDQIEVPKWIEIAKVFSIRGDLGVIRTQQNLGPTKGIFETLV